MSDPKSLANVIDATVAHMPLALSIRSDMVVESLLRSYKKVRTNMDVEAILSELSDIAVKVSLDGTAFPLDTTAGLAQARDSRFGLQSLRDRVTTISGSAKKQLSRYRKVYRVGYLYVRQKPEVTALTAKLADSICEVSLREIVEDIDDMKEVISSAKETLSSLDAKSSTVDSWFALHKQYVFMLGKSRGPRGEEETYNNASNGQRGRGIGRKSTAKRQRTQD